MHPVFHLLSINTSFSHGSLPAGLTQTFILQGFEPLVVLPKLSCFSFQLTLITGHGSIKRCPGGSPVFLTHSALSQLLSSNLISPWQSGSITPTTAVIFSNIRDLQNALYTIKVFHTALFFTHGLISQQMKFTNGFRLMEFNSLIMFPIILKQPSDKMAEWPFEDSVMTPTRWQCFVGLRQCPSGCSQYLL